MGKASAFGSKVAIQYAQTGSYTDIGSVGDITGPEVSVETIDVTTHDSPDAFAEFVAGLGDGGSLEFELAFDKNSAAHETLYNAAAGRLLHNFYLKLPGFTSTGAGGYWAFAGLIVKAGPLGAPVKDKLAMPMSIKVSGKPVYTKFTS